MTKSSYHDGKSFEACYFCRARGTEEHHIIPRRFDGPNTAENIVDVCSSCHKKLERLYDKSFYEWFDVDDETGVRQFHRPCTVSDCTNSTTRILAGWKLGYDGRMPVCEQHADEFTSGERSGLRTSRQTKVYTLEELTIESTDEVDS